jgi:hypothetical protein
MKWIYVILFILLCLPVGAVKSNCNVEPNITVMNGAGVVNITFGGSTYYLNCNNTETHTYYNEFTCEVDWEAASCGGLYDNVTKLLKDEFKPHFTNCDACYDKVKEMQSYYAPYVSCIANISSSQTQISMLSEVKTNLDKCEVDKETCSTNLVNLNKQYADLDAQAKTCAELKAKCDSDLKGSNNKIFLGILIGAAAAFIIRYIIDLRKRPPKSPTEGLN